MQYLVFLRLAYHIRCSKRNMEKMCTSKFIIKHIDFFVSCDMICISEGTVPDQLDIVDAQHCGQCFSAVGKTLRTTRVLDVDSKYIDTSEGALRLFRVPVKQRASVVRIGALSVFSSLLQLSVPCDILENI